jgi:hypothetical protein
LPLVSTPPAELVAKFAAGVVDTSDEFATGIVDTSSNFAADVVDTGGKFSTGVVYTGVVHLDLQISPQICEKI